MDSGKIMIWRGSEFTCGKMEEDTKDSIITIRNVDSEYTTGLMEESMKDGGTKASSMVSDVIWILAKPR